ncbi:MAG: ISAzo13 family transposase [Promethearchaeota archaeon]
MAYRLTFDEGISIQKDLWDFMGRSTSETIDLRTPEGKKRYKELFRRKARNKCQKQPSKPLRDIKFLFSIYNERDRRLFAGFLARALGLGGVKKTAELTCLDEKTVRRGAKEPDERDKCFDSRIRRKGGGRPTKAEEDPRYEPTLRELIEDELAGDPMKVCTWVRKDLRWMSEKLGDQGIQVSHNTVRNKLKKFNVSLKKNKKSKSTQNHSMREEQFEYLNKLKHFFLSLGKPIFSADTKKKELIGNFKNNGKVWCEEPIEVLDHDFPNLGIGKLVPYGIYDLKSNKGHVFCGISHDTSEFAVECISKWWEAYGLKQYPNATELLILVDSGGSNGYRRRGWKWGLQTKLADRFGLNVHVCHYPSGASKYNPIERKLFSFISKNWAGEPLISYEKALGFISSTKTEGGLEVSASLVEKEYETGIKVSNEQMASLNIKHAKTCPQWNYCIRPR